MENSSISFLVIKRSSDFELLREKGRRSHLSHWLLVNYINNEQGVFRFGMTVSSKVGNAVVRNKLKRWCRTYFSKIPESFESKGIEINLVFKPKKDPFFKDLLYEEFEKTLDSFFRKTGKT